MIVTGIDQDLGVAFDFHVELLQLTRIDYVAHYIYICKCIYTHIYIYTHTWVMSHMNESCLIIMSHVRTFQDFYITSDSMHTRMAWRKMTPKNCVNCILQFDALAYLAEVATIRRLLKIVGLFCRISSL